MSTQTQNLRGPSSIVGTVRARLAKTQIGGRPPSYYLAGWRLGVFFLVLAILFPLVITDQSLQVTAILVGIYVLLALGLNIVVGYAGLLDLGYVAFFVVGSYSGAIFTGSILLRTNVTGPHIPTLSFWFLLPLAASVACL